MRAGGCSPEDPARMRKAAAPGEIGRPGEEVSRRQRYPPAARFRLHRLRPLHRGFILFYVTRRRRRSPVHVLLLDGMGFVAVIFGCVGVGMRRGGGMVIDREWKMMSSSPNFICLKKTSSLLLCNTNDDEVLVSLNASLT